MKQIICTVLIVIAGVSAGQSQGLYVKLGGGYAIPMGSQNLFEPFTVTTAIVGNNTVTTTITEGVKGSYGAGININAGIGYKFSPFIGFDLNLNYLLGKEYSAESSAQDQNLNGRFLQSRSGKGFFVSPALLFMAGTENIRPYALMGMVLGSAKITDETALELGGRTDPVIAYSITEETRGDIAIGFRGGLGVDFNINDRFSVFAEAIFTSLSYYPKEKEIVRAIAGDDNFLDDLTTSEKKTVYKDKVTLVRIDGVFEEDPDQPSEELRTPYPFSSLSFNFGIKMKFGFD